MRHRLMLTAAMGTVLACALFVAADDVQELISAIRHGRMGTIKDLLDRGTNVNGKGEGGYTPLLEAASRGDKRIVELLIEKGADVTLRHRMGFTPLTTAAGRGHKEVVELLLREGVSIEEQGAGGDTALVAAVRGGHKELVEFLLAKGANVNAMSPFGPTPLNNAILVTRMDVPNRRAVAKELVQILIAAGADVNTETKDFAMGDTVEKTGGRTPLHLAAGDDANTEIAQILIDRGAEVNHKAHDGRTPLHDAVRLGAKDMAALLLRNGARTDIKDEEDMTPLDWAVTTKKEDIAAILAKHKGPSEKGTAAAAIKQDDQSRKAAAEWAAQLREAAKFGDVDTVKSLLSNIVGDINAADERGMTALILASNQGHADIAELLLNKKASVDVADHVLGRTPLHFAAPTGDASLVGLLIWHGADVNAVDKWGRTPMDRAETAEVKRILRGRGGKLGGGAEEKPANRPKMP